MYVYPVWFPLFEVLLSILCTYPLTNSSFFLLFIGTYYSLYFIIWIYIIQYHYIGIAGVVLILVLVSFPLVLLLLIFGRCFLSTQLVGPGYVKKKLLLIALLHYCFPSGDPALAWRNCINLCIVLWWYALFAACGWWYILYVRGRYFDPVLLL